METILDNYSGRTRNGLKISRSEIRKAKTFSERYYFQICIITTQYIENNKAYIVEMFMTTVNNNLVIYGYNFDDLRGKISKLRCDYCGNGGTLYAPCSTHKELACIPCHEKSKLLY